MWKTKHELCPGLSTGDGEGQRSGDYPHPPECYMAFNLTMYTSRHISRAAVCHLPRRAQRGAQRAAFPEAEPDSARACGARPSRAAR